MYAIDQKTLHRRIMKKLHRTQAIANLNEIGLILICAVTAVVLIGFRSESIFNYTIAGALVVIGGLLLRSRHRRKKRENQFDHTLLGDLDHAIEQADYLVKMANSFFWWFLLPVALPAILNMWFSDKPINLAQRALVLGAFLLLPDILRLLCQLGKLLLELGNFKVQLLPLSYFSLQFALQADNLFLH